MRRPSRAPSTRGRTTTAGSAFDLDHLSIASKDRAAIPAAVYEKAKNDGIAKEKLGPDAQLAIPTPDHYLPFVSVLGLQRSDERPEILIDGDASGGLGMLSVAMR